MSSSLLTVEGMFSEVLAMERVLGCAVIDSDGRLLVSMIDVLAIMRLAADAEVVLVRFRDGASQAFRVPEIVGHDDVFLQLLMPERSGARGVAWSARLWSRETGPSAPVVSISAMWFASFVGLE